MYWESIGETNYYFTLKYKLLLYILEDDLVERKFLIRKIKWVFVDWMFNQIWIDIEWKNDV